MEFTLNIPVKYIFGKNTIERIGAEIAAENVKKVLLLAGGGSIKKNGVYDQVVNSLKQNGIEWIELWDVQPNPVLSHARKAIEIVKRDGLEAILAVGGGSVIDEAKAIAGGFYLGDVWEAFSGKARIKKALPIFTVLTLSASASEINTNAVLLNEETNQKWATGAPSLFPKVSIVDPTVQYSLPWNQTVNGFIDSMSHITEVYFTDDIEISLELYEGIMRTLISSIKKLKLNEQDYLPRANLVYSSSMALSAFPRCGCGGDWSQHGIEHGISGMFPKIAHAAGLSALYPAWLEFMYPYNKSIFDRWAVKVFGVETFDEALKAFLKLLVELDSPYSIKQLGIKEEDIEPMTDLILQGGQPGKLKSLDKADIMTILRNSYNYKIN
ncbi:MAG: iron-containing alcohol dehydrogenase [bacterium]